MQRITLGYLARGSAEHAAGCTAPGDAAPPAQEA